MALTYDAPLTGNPGGPDFETAIQVGYTQFAYPNRGQGSRDSIIFSRVYIIKEANWAASTLDSEDIYNSGFYLYEESTPEDIDPGGLCRWEKWFGNVPTWHDTYSFQAVTFPGYYSEWNADNPVSPATSVYRPPLTKVVKVRETRIFALTTTPWTSFTPLAAMKLYNQENGVVDYVDNNTTTNPGGYPATGSSLTYAEYQAKVNGTATDTEITVKEPEIRRAYGAGNIWEMVQYLAVAE